MFSEITKLSNRYGSNPNYVLAGGGNTSCKDSDFLYVKPSEIPLATIKTKNFIKLKRDSVNKVFSIEQSLSAPEREKQVKNLMALSVCSDFSGRPSVEAPLHNIIPYKYVVHTHPAIVNGMTCGKKGKEICNKLFPKALWVDYIDPGYTLASKLYSLLSEYNEKDSPKTIFLQNHGVFVGADTPCEIDEIYKDIMTKLKTFCNDFDSSILKSPLKIDSILDNRLVSETAPELRTLLSPEKQKRIILSSSYFDVAEGPLTPDHIVYSCSFPLIGSCKKTDIDNFSEKRGYLPKVVCIPQKAVFTSGTSLKDAKTSMSLAKDAAYVYQLTKAFGGARFLNEREYGFIENWEVESYRKKVSENSEKQGLLQNKITIITGGAQGFGFGIAQELAKEGATIAIADINLSGAQEATQKLEDEFGKDRFLALEVDISKEDAVEKMIDNVVALTGGLDLFIANAGVLKAGPVKDFDRKNWDFVTNINYHGYFLCTKYASKIMALQNKFENSDWTDIVQINSKSGLEGSKRNAAYAGSKFGTIGLTQSFALELVQDKIKVNSICPGNFFSGPLWSNPDNGLFVQYLNSDKVPGAKTLEDVKKYYEAQIPMNRGCLPKDVAKAIFYVVGQQYETGQAIPVTGGQVMLH